MYKNNIKLASSTLFGLTSVILLASCASEPELFIPPCDYKNYRAINQSVQSFVWDKQKNDVLTPDWQQITLKQIAKKNQYVHRKGSTGILKAEKELAWLNGQLTTLKSINNDLLTNIAAQTCLAGSGIEAPDYIEKQNQAIDYVLQNYSELTDDVAHKKLMVEGKILMQQ